MKKICSRCKLAKEGGCFNRRTGSRDGLGAYCKDCKRDYDRKLKERIAGSIVKEKICTICQVVKSAGEFHRHSQRKDGLDSRCKICKIRRVMAAAATEKMCTSCRAVKPLSCFHKKMGCRYGVDSKCKICKRAKRQKKEAVIPRVAG